jgi:hypothetical protein
MPLLHKIRDLKYNETFVWHNDYTNTCNLIQNKYSITNLSFTSSNDKVLAYDIEYSVAPKKKRVFIESSSSTEPGPGPGPGLESEPGPEPQPIYGDGLDGVTWNVPEYENLWSRLPSGLRVALISDREWMQDFMDSCVAARAAGQSCTFTSPKTLILPPEMGPDGKYNFGVNIYNQAFESLPEPQKKIYLTFYTEQNGVTNYNMLTNAMNDLVAKMVQFDRGYF